MDVSTNVAVAQASCTYQANKQDGELKKREEVVHQTSSDAQAGIVQDVLVRTSKAAQKNNAKQETAKLAHETKKETQELKIPFLSLSEKTKTKDDNKNKSKSFLTLVRTAHQLIDSIEDSQQEGHADVQRGHWYTVP